MDQCVVRFKVMVRSEMMGEAGRRREGRRGERERGAIPEEVRGARFPEQLEKKDGYHVFFNVH